MKDELGSISITTGTPKEYVERLAAKCDRCGHCCSFDSGIFLDEDIKRIADYLGIPKSEFIRQCLEEKTIFNKAVHKAKLNRNQKPFGACLFFDKGEGCIVNAVKPLHCKVSSGCKEFGRELNIWFMLNYVVDEHDAQAVREWASYLKTHPTIPGGELHELVPDKERREKILRHEKLR